MKLARHDRRLLAWMLLFCILFSAMHCASGLGQMVAMQLSEAAEEHAHQHAEAASAHSHSSEGGCDFASPFSAIILAAFFGLLALLAVEAARLYPSWVLLRQPRFHWPPANPRAPPQQLSVL